MKKKLKLVLTIRFRRFIQFNFFTKICAFKHNSYELLERNKKKQSLRSTNITLLLSYSIKTTNTTMPVFILPI